MVGLVGQIDVFSEANAEMLTVFQNLRSLKNSDRFEEWLLLKTSNSVLKNHILVDLSFMGDVV